jgi:2-phospho-L-lactate guanylyltransferase
MSGMARSRGADLSRLVVIVPIHGLEGAKSRLGATLDAEERQALVLGLLDRTIRAAAGISGLEAVVVVSPDPSVLRAASVAGATPLRQTDDGLNEGLRAATRWAIAARAGAILALAGDLPAVSTATLQAILAAAVDAASPERPLVALVPDRHGRGTNVLLLSPPDAIPFAFGADSRLAHLDAARAAGAEAVELGGPLTLDLDLPEDLILAEELGLLDPARVG